MSKKSDKRQLVRSSQDSLVVPRPSTDERWRQNSPDDSSEGCPKRDLGGY